MWSICYLLLSIKKFLLKVSSQNQAKDPIWNFYCTFEDDKILVLYACPVTQKSVLRSLDNLCSHHENSLKTKTKILFKDPMNNVC